MKVTAQDVDMITYGVTAIGAPPHAIAQTWPMHSTELNHGTGSEVT